MNETALMICNAFMQRGGPDRKMLLLNYLPESQLQQLAALRPTNKDPVEPIEGIEDQLNEIHPSWMSSYLRTLAASDIRLFISALRPERQEDLKKELLFTNHIPTLKPLSKQFLQKTLYEQLTKDEADLLPVEYLPVSPLNSLLSLSFSDLLTLIDLLGISDLAYEIRFVIEAAKYKQLLNALNDEEQRLLRKMMQQKDMVTFARMNFSKWDGQRESLKVLLHQRGINRLAKALVRESPSLKWHLCHRLDTERASTFNKLSTELDNPRALVILSDQVLDLIDYLEKRNAS